RTGREPARAKRRRDGSHLLVADGRGLEADSLLSVHLLTPSCHRSWTRFESTRVRRLAKILESHTTAREHFWGLWYRGLEYALDHGHDRSRPPDRVRPSPRRGGVPSHRCDRRLLPLHSCLPLPP